MVESITLIQGDTLTLTIDGAQELSGVPSQISFKSKSLNINSNFTKDLTLNYWTLSFTALQTAAFRLGNFTYDITATYSSDVKTIVHNGNIEVLYKTNK